MRDPIILLVHLIATLARLMGPAGGGHRGDGRRREIRRLAVNEPVDGPGPRGFLQAQVDLGVAHLCGVGDAAQCPGQRKTRVAFEEAVRIRGVVRAGEACIRRGAEEQSGA